MRAIILLSIFILTSCYSYNVSTMPCVDAEKQWGHGNENVIVTKINVYDKDHGCEVKIKHKIN